MAHPVASLLPVPPVPWQITGNHWLSLPCIHPGDAAIHCVGVLHRGARAAVEFAGGVAFVQGGAPPLFRPSLTVDGERRELGAHGLAWERALGWIPTFTCALDGLVVRGTIVAPYGRDADVAGAVYAFTLENRTGRVLQVGIALDGELGHRQLRVRSPRSFEDEARLVTLPEDVLVLEGAALPGLVALALATDGEARVTTAAGPAPRFSMAREVALAPGARTSIAFFIAAGPERDGAVATVHVMRRRGWSELLAATRDALQQLEQTVGHEGMDRLVNQNLLFAYFYAAGRALDDAHFYLVRSRAPWNGHGVTSRDWEALAWTLPAVLLVDPPLARELLLRTCELHGYAPGSGVHYLDGTIFEAGFSLDGVAAFPLAADRYMRETGDEQLVDDPVLADTLYGAAEDLAARRDANVPLYSTELTVDGASASYPFTLHGNAVVAQALAVLRRTLDEETARGIPDPEAVRAALRRHFAVEREGRVIFAAATDLAGRALAEGPTLADAYWLPLYDAVDRHDSVYRRTVRAAPAGSDELVVQCARLVGPHAGEVLQWLRRAPLDNGVAAEVVDEAGAAVANGGDAALAGLLAWCAWYAVHALGAQP